MGGAGGLGSQTLISPHSDIRPTLTYITLCQCSLSFECRKPASIIPACGESSPARTRVWMSGRFASQATQERRARQFPGWSFHGTLAPPSSLYKVSVSGLPPGRKLARSRGARCAARAASRPAFAAGRFQLSSGVHFICDGVSGRQSMACGVKPIEVIWRKRCSAASKVALGKPMRT